MSETLKYCKVRDVKDPKRAHSIDAGIDFFIPTDLKTDDIKMEVTKDIVFVQEVNGKVKSITLAPGQSVLIPSGIHVKVPEGYALVYMNKSGVASKKHLHVGACVVDSGYEGECHLNLTNVGSTNIMIEAGEKIVQALLIPISTVQTEDVGSLDALYAGQKSDRGTGGFGSTSI